MQQLLNASSTNVLSGYSSMKREMETSSSMAHDTWTTCSKVVQSEVNTLQTELQRLLGQNLLGVYLHGSLALGGFQPGRSDIDIIVVTAQRIDLETKRRCIELLLRISKMPCPLDIRFLVEQDLFSSQYPLFCDLHYSETLAGELSTGVAHWHLERLEWQRPARSRSRCPPHSPPSIWDLSVWETYC